MGVGWERGQGVVGVWGWGGSVGMGCGESVWVGWGGVMKVGEQHFF